MGAGKGLSAMVQFQLSAKLLIKQKVANWICKKPWHQNMQSILMGFSE